MEIMVDFLTYCVSIGILLILGYAIYVVLDVWRNKPTHKCPHSYKIHTISGTKGETYDKSILLCDKCGSIEVV